MFDKKDIEAMRKNDSERFRSLSLEERLRETRIWQNSVFYASKLKKKCNHTFETAIGFRFSAVFNVTVQMSDGFQIRQKFCVKCGKTLELTIIKPRQPRKPNRLGKEGETIE